MTVAPVNLHSARTGRGWRIRWIGQHYLEGDHVWARLRWLSVIAAVGLIWLAANLAEAHQPLDLPARPAVESSWLAWLGWFVRFVGAAALSPEARRLWRHLIPAWLAWTVAFRLGARYLDDLFELQDLKMARDYLRASLFGRPTLTMHIADGQVSPDDRSGAMVRIGGPGTVSIEPGNAALFERGGSPTTVKGAGASFVRRFETLREVVDLREQFRTREEVRAVTKDGIPVVVKNVQAQFSVRTGGRQRTPADPYPFSPGAVKRVVYGKSVGKKGATPWADSLIGDVATMIAGWIARRRIDDVTTPEDGAPRQELHDLFLDREVRRRFAEKGVDLLWVSIGQIQPDPAVTQQRMRTWAATTTRDRRILLAEGEAYSEKLQELARAQAQTILLTAIADALEPVDLTVGATQADLVVRRVTDALTQIARRPDVSERLLPLGGTTSLLGRRTPR